MTYRKSDLTVYSLTVAMLLTGCIYCAHMYGVLGAAKSQTIASDSATDHISHADMYYWFAMYGRGSQAAIRGGQSQAELADADLAAELAAGSIDADTETRERKRLNGIWEDLRYQKNMYHNTFHGVFPWSHFMAKPTLFVNSRATGSFEMLDDPWEIAVRGGLSDLIDKVLEAQTVVGQHDVVFVTDPDDFSGNSELNSHIIDPKADRNDAAWPKSGRERNNSWEFETQLENEALYLFNMNPRFFVHNRLEVETALTPEEHLALRRLEPTEEILQKLRENWGHNDLLVVRVKKMDEFDFHHFYSAQGRLYQGTDPAAAVIYNNYGFCRDRRHMFVPVLVFNGMMLITAIILFRFLAQLGAHDRQPPSWKGTLGLGSVCFVWGRAAVWGLAEVVEEIVPEDEVLAILSFWWPALTGFVMLIGPAFVMRFAEERFGWLSESFRTYNRGGAIFAAVTVGSFAYVGQAALWVRAWGGWKMAVPMFVGAVLAGWIIGRALDNADSMKGRWGVGLALLALGLGPAFSNSDPTMLWYVAIPMIALSIPAVLDGNRTIVSKATQKSDAERPVPVDSPDTLIHAAQNPPFLKTTFCDDVMQRLKTWGENGQTVRIQLVGQAGVGKSALIREITGYDWGSVSPAAMHGVCSEPQDGSVPEPYQPIAEAIADHFSVNLLMPPARQFEGIDKAVDGIFEEVVPFSDLLFPPSHRHGGASGSKTEMFRSIAAMLERLARERPVMLVVDDVHWIDSGSLELLEYLLSAFPAKGTVPIAIIAAGREPLSAFSVNESVQLEELGPDEIRRLLVEGLKFTPDAAQQLADAAGGQNGNLHWLFQMIIHMASADVFQWQDEGFAWDSSTQLSDHLPNDLLDSIQSALSEHPEFRDVLECAACIGPEFTVSVLSDSLEISRLECVRLLDQIEVKTGLVRDLQRDERFAFRSSFMLEALRTLLHVNAHGPTTPSPQRIREYHTQLATTWESTLDRSQKAVFRLATHRYASGQRHAQRAVDASLHAAQAASSQYQHELARQFVEMARECAAVSAESDDNLERELLLIECHEAHMEGTRRVEIAEKALDWMSNHDDAGIDIFVAAAQACYDAGIDTRDQSHFANSVAVAEEIVSRFDSPLDQAEGHHFVGIGLPVTERDARSEHLNKALELVDADGGSIEAMRLKSRICNSLGEQLSYGSDEDRQRAKEMFETSIELKNRPSIRDVEGLAFAHGGLGRLSFFASEPDFDTAREHFAEDLRYSEKIGSRTGQTKMHSLLGACDLKQNQDFESALTHYHAASTLAEERVDRYFALAGLLECCGGLARTDDIARYGASLLSLVDECVASLPEDVRSESPGAAIPRMCQPGIQAGLDACASANSDAWHQRISEILSKN